MSDKKSYMEQVESGLATKARLEDLELAKTQATESKALEMREWTAKEKLLQIVLKGNDIITPERSYQKDPEYWAVQNEFLLIKHGREEIEHKQKLSQIDKRIEVIDSAIKEIEGE